MERKNLKFSLVATLIVIATGCTSQRNTEVDPTSIDTSSTDTSTYTNTTSSIGSLYDTTTTNDTAATTQYTTATTTTPITDQQEIACLSGNSSGYYTNTSGLQACTAASQNYLGDDYVLNSVLGSLQHMHDCYNTVRSSLANSVTSSTASSANTHELFQSARMALVRCFRTVVENQRNSMVWNQSQYQNFAQIDGSLWYILNQFAN